VTTADFSVPMAGYGAIRDAMESLAALLRAHITNSGEAGLAGVPVRVNSPREVELANVSSAVAVWLHRVDVAADLLNATPPRPSSDRESHRPLPVELAVSVVPINGEAAVANLLLGRVLQVLSDHRRLTGAQLAGTLASSGTVLTLGLDLHGAYELNLLWSGQQTNARPSVGLRVAGVVIDSHLDDLASAPVLDATIPLAQIVGATA